MGMYRYARMTFGLARAPAWFQHVMQYCLDRSGVEGVRAFLDDVTVGGSRWDPEELWERTRRVLFAMAEVRMMINLRKCKLLVPSGTVLGIELEAGGYRIV